MSNKDNNKNINSNKDNNSVTTIQHNKTYIHRNMKKIDYVA